MAFCNQCGTQLGEGAKFCANCGAPAAASAGGSAPSAPSTASRPAGFERPEPAVRASGGLGWILPALIVLAAIVIAYLIFSPPSGDRPVTPADQAVVRGDEGTREAGSAGGASGSTGAVGAVPGASEGLNTNSGGGSGYVSAAVLDSAFNSDPAGAAARYAGPIRVSGTIASMVQPGPTPALSMEGRTRFNFIVVNFLPGYRERLAPLSKGQFISVACDEVRQLAGTTILSRCILA